jgi:hypothetical protein
MRKLTIGLVGFGFLVAAAVAPNRAEAASAGAAVASAAVPAAAPAPLVEESALAPCPSC